LTLTFELDRELFTTKSDTFGLFDDLIKDYKDKSILDFGGNHGNLIKSSNGKIKKENYTCLDISIVGLNNLPKDVKSIHWNAYHPTYNTLGNVDEPFPKLSKYDIIFANSVFTHNTIEQMLYCIKELLKTKSTLYFTYIDTTNIDFFKGVKQYKPIYIDEQIIKNKQNKNFYYILNHEKIVTKLQEDWNDLWLIINSKYLQSLIHSVVSDSLTIDYGRARWLNYMKITP
jgi:hypothetical protein